MITCAFSLDDVIEMLDHEGVDFEGEHFSRDYANYLKRFESARAMILAFNPELKGKMLPIEDPRTMLYRLSMNMPYNEQRELYSKYNRKFTPPSSRNPFRPETI